MKKLFLAVIMMVSSLAVMAQVENFKGNLSEAIAKAKAENKKVMLIVSTTWCGPCKMLANNIFPTPVSGNYINPRFVVIKYNVDVADPDNVSKLFDVKAYPTIVILGDSGKEITRLLGGAKDAEGFNDRLEVALAPGKTYVERKALNDVDKSNVANYIKFLKEDVYKSEEADILFRDLFASRTVAENFTPDWVDYYKKNVNSIDSPVFKTMLEKSAEVIEVMGKENYDKFMKNKANDFIYSQVATRQFNRSNYDSLLSTINANPTLASNYSQFAFENGNNVEARNADALMAAAKKAIKKGDFDSKMNILSLASMFIPRENLEKYKPKVLALYESIAKSEENVDNKNKVLSYIDMIKNHNAPAKRVK